MRQGIDDARLLHALDAALKTAPDDERTRAARAFRDALWKDVDLDLRKSYRLWCASYSEDLFVKPDNPWMGGKLSATRKDCARHLEALSRR
jgi:hypothetical protein